MGRQPVVLSVRPAPDPDAELAEAQVKGGVAPEAEQAETEELVRRGPNVGLVRRLCVLAGLAGVASLALAVTTTPVMWPRPWLFLIFTIGLTALQVMPLMLSHEGQGENIHLEEAFLVPMILTLSRVELLIAFGTAVAVGHAWRRRGWLKVSFNAGQYMAAALIAIVAARHLGSRLGSFDTRSIVAAVAGGLVFSLASTLFVTWIIMVAQQSGFGEVLLDGRSVRAATWATSLAVGVLIASAMRTHLWTLPLAVLPIAMLQLIYSRAFGQYRERRQIERLYDAAASIRSSIDNRVVVHQLLAASQTLLDAAEARIVDVNTAAPTGALRAPVDDTIAVEVVERTGGGEWAANDAGLLRALASVASTTLANATLFQQMRTITSSLGEGVISLDRHGRVDFVNPAAESLLGWDAGQLLGRDLHDLVHAHVDGAADSCLLGIATMTGTGARNDDDVFAHRGGRLVPVAHTVAPVQREGQVVGSVIAFRDITERKAFEQELAHQAFHDTLTGLANRAVFVDRLAQAHARATRSGSLYALLFIDLDRFKVVNDSLGHQAGDQLLIAVAERLRPCVRPGDTFARFGGDEFVALIEDLTSEDDATTVAERVLEELKGSFAVELRDVSVSASIGLVIGDGTHTSPDHCLRDADVAMYRAKAKGKARYEIFRSDVEDGSLQQLDTEIALRGAVQRNELVLHYQPIVSVGTGRIQGMEALVRWNHPTRGLLAPGEFIGLAEESGMILELGRWVLEEACRQIRDWQERYLGAEPMVMTVNLSGRQFAQSDLCEQVAEVIAETGVDPRHLCFEVTESVMMDDVESAIAKLRKLKELGLRVAIDDFGTGYSSLSYLKKFPVDVVKIDRSFIADLGETAVDSEIVRAVIRLASAIGMTTVAEGVETEDQLDQLRAMGCQLVQGFHLARPQPPHQLEALLGSRIDEAGTARSSRGAWDGPGAMPGEVPELVASGALSRKHLRPYD